MNSGVAKLYKLIFLPVLALCISNTINAQPIITQVKVTNSDCKNNGVIEVIAKGISGVPVYKLDKMKLDTDGNPTEEIESTQQNTGIGQNKFQNLEEGKYFAYIYDDVTGLNGVKSDLAVLKTTYRSFLGSVEVSQVFDYSVPCGNTGAVTFKIATDKPGKAPYSYVLTNNETNEKWESLNSVSTSRQFSKLPGGTYSYTVSDACGSSFYSTSLVVVSRETAKDVEIVSFKNVGQYVSTNSEICSRMTLYISDIGRGELNGTTGDTGIARTHSRDLEYQIDYPAGSNTWKYAGSPNGSQGFYLYITDFDSNSAHPNYLKYKIRVFNKCNGTMAEDPTVYEFGKATTTFSFSPYIDYSGLNICSIPDSAEVTIKPVKKIGSYSCLQPGKYPLTITLTQTSPIPSDPLNPPVIQYIWTEENTTAQGEYKMKVPTNTTYKKTIVDRDGTLLYTTNSYRVAVYKPAVYLQLQANTVNTCDPTSYEIAYRISVTTPSNGTIKHNYAGWPIKFKILKAPEGVVIAPGDSIKEKIIENTSNYLQIWENLPIGAYEIEVDKGCEKEIIKVATLTSYVTKYEPYEPYSEAVGCKQHRLKVGAMYYDANGAPKPTAHYIYLWWFNPIRGVYEYKERFNSYVGTDGGWTASKPMLETGKFVVRYSLNSNLSSATPNDGKCDLRQYEIEVNEIYKAPEIILAESGGISCQLGQGADFTVAAENSISRPFTYQIKKYGAPDSEYSVAQSDSIFRNVVPGEYDVKLNTNCDGVTSSIVQTMRMYDGIKDKFMSLTGSFLDGQACSDQSATFSLKAVGPVESYQWFKDGVALTGVITDVSGRTYTIPSVTKADMGIYTLEINTGNCFLRSSDTIKSILPTPLKPTIVSECGETATYLTAIGSEPESTFIWYKDGVVVKNNTTNKLLTTGRGRYSVVERTPNGCLSFPSDPAIISYTEMYWKHQANQDWNDPNNWVDVNGVALNDIPGVCTTVHISGNENKNAHPSLDEYTDTYGKPTCETVVFHYGSQLGYPHVLNYKKALVQYNFGYYNGNNVVDGQPTGNAQPAYPAIYRGNWKLLAAPMKSMVSGDFALGGYPFTWQSQLNTTATKAKSGSSRALLTEASFAQPFPANDVLLNTNNNAFALKVTTYQNGVGYDNHKFLETHKGIIEYPYYENKDIMDTRPGYWVDPISGSNYLSYFDNNTLQTIFNPIGMVKRGKESYRFVFENDKNVVDTIQVAGAWYGKPGYTQTIDPKGSDLVMVGNPFMSSIDFLKFLNCNADVLDVNAGYYTFHSDRIWHNKLDGFINPLDAFVIKLKTTNPVKLIYPMELTLVEATRMATRTTDSRFSVGAMIQNVEIGDRGDLIRTTDAVDQLYVPKLIYPEGHDIPEVYFVSPTGSMNLRQGYKEGQPEVVLGVKCSNTNEPITLTFHDTEVLSNGDRKPVLIDKYLNLSQDLTESDNYTFIQRPVDAKKQYADNTRFVISFKDSDIQIESQIDIRLRNHNELHVVSNTGLSTIAVFDLQGRSVLSKTNIASSNYQQELTLAKGVYIVKATTTDGENKSQKISVK